MEDFGTNTKEIVLTEVVEPPKDTSLASGNDAHEHITTAIDAKEPHGDFHEIDVLFDEEQSTTNIIADEDVDTVIQDVLADNTSDIDVQSLFEENTAVDISNTNITENTIEELDTQPIQDIDATPSTDDALNKLDNLDAMIDTMISTSAPADSTIIETVEALSKRVEDLENVPKEEEFSLTTLHERIVILEGQYTALQNSINEIQDHLESLLSLPKKINDIDKELEILSSTSPTAQEEYTTAIQSIDERIQHLHTSIEQTTQSLEIVSLLEQRSGAMEEQLNSLLEQCTSPTHNNDAMILADITSKLQQLEFTVEQIVRKQHIFEEQTSLQALHNALLPSIEKEAILAASRIIKEELQSILRWK